MSNVQLPSEQEFKGFMDKLAQFRGTLGESEQKMLDAMCMASFSTAQEKQADVQGYEWVWGPAGWVWLQPRFVQTGYVANLSYTPFGAVYNTVPTGFWVP